MRACHDLSEGGLGVALAEMSFAGGLGAEIALTGVPADNVDRDDFILFSESNSRFLAEVAPRNQSRFEQIMTGNAFALIGKVTEDARVRVIGLTGSEIVNLSWMTLKDAWQRPLDW